MEVPEWWGWGCWWGSNTQEIPERDEGLEYIDPLISSQLKYVFRLAGLGFKVNFSIHLQSSASKIFSTSKLVRPLANSFQMFGRHALDNSNSQTFASGYFSHLHLGVSER